MKVDKLPFEKTNAFSRLFLDYVNAEKALASFYNQPPSPEGIFATLKHRRFPQDRRQALQDVLCEQYEAIKPPSPVRQNIRLLKEENTFTVTTGHQLNVCTGPLYFIYKIVTAVNAAAQLKEKYPAYNFVPLYWMASEDHDFEEISSFYLSGKRYRWASDQTGAVGRFDPSSLQALMNTIPERLPFFPDAYGQSATLAEAARRYVSDMFSEEGVIALDADHRILKRIFAPVIREEVLNQRAKEQVASANEALKALGYDAQAFARPINMFYLEADYRARMVKEGERYHVKNQNKSFSAEEIEKEIEEFPERFSPNVIMRPVYQETVLPNLGYVGGPAEIAYWLQLKQVFNHHHVSFPVLLPRNFGLYISRNIQRKMQRQALTGADLFGELKALKAKVLRQAGADFGFEPYKTQVRDTYRHLAQKAGAIDPTLAPFVQSEAKNAQKKLDHIADKMRKAQERNRQTAIRQVTAVKEALFPSGVLQERHDNFLDFYFNNPDFIKEVIQSLDPFDMRFHLMTDE